MRLILLDKKGFTLLEIIVVVAILGVLAAIVIPNIMGLQNEGRVDSANTEAYNCQLAILSAMIDSKFVEISQGTVGPDNIDIKLATGNVDTIPEIDLTDYIEGVLQAVYTIDTGGHIIAASEATLTNSKWDGLTYTENAGWSG